MVGIAFIAIILGYILVMNFIRTHSGIVVTLLILFGALFGGWTIGAGIADKICPGSWKEGGIVGIAVVVFLLRFVIKNSKTEN